MKFVAYALAGSLLAIAPASARPGEDSPTATNENPSSCLGAERATRNSAGGDREKGGFGEAQSTYVATLNASGTSFGEFLQTWMDACPNAPGSMNDDDED